MLYSDLFVLPNELWRRRQASLESRAKNNAQLRGALFLLLVVLSSQVHLPELKKGVFRDYRFVGELRSLPLGL
jgi:hypothetical protein